jgi:hypothetical protein
MDLHLVMQELRPNENVGPDLSSWTAMHAKWRGVGPCPTERQCLDKWEEIKGQYEDLTALKDQKEALALVGVTDAQKLDALWNAIAKKDTSKMEDLLNTETSTISAIQAAKAQI